MSESRPPEFGINSWLEDELYQQYLNDRKTVDESWKEVFETNGGSVPEAPAPGPQTGRMRRSRRWRCKWRTGISVDAPVPEHQPVAGETLIPLRGAAARIAENMKASLSIPLATSQRVMPVKVIDENRRIINEHRALHRQEQDLLHAHHRLGHREGASSNPDAESCVRGNERRAVSRGARPGQHRHRGGRGGQGRRAVAQSARTSRMPASLDFAQFVAAFDDIVARARSNKLTVQDFEGTTISLTNPGTVGTLGSVPRLMPGQGAIIATGAIDYPAEYHGVDRTVARAARA